MLTARSWLAATRQLPLSTIKHRARSSFLSCSSGGLAPCDTLNVHATPTSLDPSGLPCGLRSFASRVISAPRHAHHPATRTAYTPSSQPHLVRLSQRPAIRTPTVTLLLSLSHSLFSAQRRHASSTADKHDNTPHKHTNSTNKTSSDSPASSLFDAKPSDASDEEPPPPDTVPAATVGNLDAEIGEAMAVTGADLSTPAQSTTASSPTSSFTQSEDMLAALEIHTDGTHSECEYSRLQLARRFGLHPRDLRFLDSSLRNLPSLLVRREVIIVNLELFKAIISATEVLMFDPWYPHIQSIVPLMKHALQAFHRANDSEEPAVPGAAAAAADQGERGDKATASSDAFKSAFDYVSSFNVKPPRMDDSTPPASTSSSASPSSASSSASHTKTPSDSSSADFPTQPSFSSSASSSTASPHPLDADHPHLPPHAGSTSAHPSLRHLAADLESTLRDRTLYGLHESEKEYEEWIEPRMPFEFIALELILMTVTRTLESRFEVYNSSLSPLLSSSSTTLNEGSTLMHLLQLKNGLTSFEVVLGETGWALRHVLQDDADMAEMFLTMKRKGQVPRIEEHGEIEVLLETYLRKVDELENEVRTNVKSISLTEEHIQIRLDTVRNAMMKVDLLLTICTFAVAASALIASTFGMNLSSHLEQSGSAFYIASLVMAALTVLLIRFGLRLCRKHKIDLFHVEPDEPKLRLPMNNLRKHKHRLSSGSAGGGGADRSGSGLKSWKRGGDSGSGSDKAGFYDREEWVSQTLEYKLRKLEEMKERQQRQLREKAEWIDREMKEKQQWMAQKEEKPRRWQGKEADRHRADR